MQFIEQYSDFFSFISIAVASFFISLPKDLSPISAVELMFQQIAKKVNLETRSDSYKRLASVLSICLIYLPTILIISQLYNVVYKPIIINVMLLFILLSWHDKSSAYKEIINALKHNKLAQAKYTLATLTERQTKPLSPLGVNKATIESMVLQLANSWFAVIFWYLLTGIYGALFYRTIQICAQQWNKKREEFDALSTIPSLIYSLMLFPVHLLVSFTFALYDKPLENLPTKFKQSIHWHHFSSGLMLASFALSMHISLGGVRLYQTQKINYAALGNDISPTIESISLSLQRIRLTAWFWLMCISGYTFFPLILTFITKIH
ncbi:cobalamin biosynthesis protein [Psychromonas sp. MME2]|uniref:cobalamin biosynthesis protein CobD/CbiB n=1 Tax=unclassified Psychromonas TaxID=2614957 RepID=UPI00339BAADD